MDKHQCYKNAIDHMLMNKGCTLVHAIVTGQGPIEGIKYGHAWIEKGGDAYDPNIELTMPAKLYRKIGQAKNIKEYTHAQMKEQINQFNHYGPWDETISDAIHLDKELA